MDAGFYLTKLNADSEEELTWFDGERWIMQGGSASLGFMYSWAPSTTAGKGE